MNIKKILTIGLMLSFSKEINADNNKKNPIKRKPKLGEYVDPKTEKIFKAKCDIENFKVSYVDELKENVTTLNYEQMQECQNEGNCLNYATSIPAYVNGGHSLNFIPHPTCEDIVNYTVKKEKTIRFENSKNECREGERKILFYTSKNHNTHYIGIAKKGEVQKHKFGPLPATKLTAQEIKKNKMVYKHLAFVNNIPMNTTFVLNKCPNFLCVTLAEGVDNTTTTKSIQHKEL
jgi:hypothetical protein